MKRTATRCMLFILALLCTISTPAQRTASNPLGGNLTMQDAGTCSTTGSFLWQQIPSNAATTTVNLAGTFSGTLTIRLSNNGGGTWTTNTTVTTAGTTSISTNGFTDICADVTTFTSGSFAVTITTGLNTGPVGPQGPAGSGGGISANSPVPANQAQGPRYNVINYGAKGDAQLTRDCGTTANSAVVTSATANWQPSIVGKVFVTTSNISNASNLTGVNITTVLSRQSATQITLAVTAINTLGSQYCAWATQDDTAAVQAAVAAASVPTSQVGITTGGPLINGGLPGIVYFPAGAYILSGIVVNCQPLTSGGLCPSVLGEGVEKTDLIFTPAMNLQFLAYSNASGVEIGKFSYTSLLASVGNGFGFIALGPVQKLYIHDIAELNCDAFVGGGTNGQLYIFNSSGANNLIDNVTMVGGGAGPLLSLNGDASGFAVRNSFFSNGTININVSNSPTRNSTDAPITFENVTSDECGTAPCTRVIAAGLNWVGGGVFGESSTGALNVDGTSTVWLSDLNIGSFTTSNNNVGLGIASGGVVYSTMNTIRGNGTSAAVNGPAGASFFDIGGNQIQNCVNTVCTNVTAAQYSTLGFAGGIVPKATVSHTPNTCYAVTGNLLATAQNICTFLLDQNYQIVNMTAQSGGTTPTNSSCATPPVITWSDGTRTATMTMTTGKTQWNSGVDAVTNLNQVFATGATLTVSIGANTCATPPVNVAISYITQSVLNP